MSSSSSLPSTARKVIVHTLSNDFRAATKIVDFTLPTKLQADQVRTCNCKHIARDEAETEHGVARHCIVRPPVYMRIAHDDSEICLSTTSSLTRPSYVRARRSSCRIIMLASMRPILTLQTAHILVSRRYITAIVGIGKNLAHFTASLSLLSRCEASNGLWFRGCRYDCCCRL